MNDDRFFQNFDVTGALIPDTNDPFERKLKKEDVGDKKQQEHRAVMSVREFMSRSDAARHPHILLSVSARSLGENWKDSGRSITKRSRLKMPDGFNIIETQAPQLYQMFFKDDQIVELEGNDVFSASFEAPMSEFINRQFKEAQINTKGYAYIKSMLYDGTAFAKVPYKFIERYQVERQKFLNEQTGEVEVEKREVLKAIFDGPDIENISIHDFFPDWAVKTPGDIQGMRAVVMRTYKTVNELKQSGIYKNLDRLEVSLKLKKDAKPFKAVGVLSNPFWHNDYRYEQDRAQDNYHQAKYAGKVEIWEYWGQYDPKGDGVMEEYIITVANGDVCIRMDENIYDKRFKPFVATPNYPRDGEFYGLPELSPQVSQLKELNTLKNARLDAINATVHPMWKIERQGGVNLQQMVYRPNGVVLNNDNNSIQKLTNNDPTPTSAQEIAQIQEQILQTSAVGLASTASGRAFARTTAGANQVASLSDNRIKVKAAILSETFFQPVVKIFMCHNSQYVDEDKIFKFSNPQLAQLDPEAVLPIEAFNLDYAFKARTDYETGGIEGHLAKLETATQFIIAAEQSQPGTFKMDKIAEAALRPLFGPGLKQFTRSDQERIAIQQQQLAAEQAVNAEIGRNAPQPNAQPGGAEQPLSPEEAALRQQ